MAEAADSTAEVQVRRTALEQQTVASRQVYSVTELAGRPLTLKQWAEQQQFDMMQGLLHWCQSHEVALIDDSVRFTIAVEIEGRGYHKPEVEPWLEMPFPEFENLVRRAKPPYDPRPLIVDYIPLQPIQMEEHDGHTSTPG